MLHFQIEKATASQIQSQMILIQFAGLTIVFVANTLASRQGHRQNKQQKRDLLLPIASILFLFYPLIISLPDANYKLTNYSIKSNSQAIDQADIYPYAFLISLVSISLSILVDRFFLRKMDVENQQEIKTIGMFIGSQNSLRYLLTLSIALQNIINFYYLCIEDDQIQFIKEISLFLIFSLLINFAHSYLLGQTGLDQGLNATFSVFMNLGLIIGFLLSFVLSPDYLLLILPCMCAGLQIYCSIFICFPSIFTNGQKPAEDKSRYCSIIIAFFITLLYYPICYLLRI